MKNVKKLSLAGMLTAAGVVTSAFNIPIGVARVFPIQHFINVLAAVVLGPIYGVSMAFLTSLIRVLMGTGSLLAFPGSMCGAFLSGILYKYTKKKSLAFAGEVIGTGIIGSLLAYPVAAFILSSETAAMFGFVIPFGLSSLAGAVISFVVIVTVEKTGLLTPSKQQI